jgi:hypothetical protein
MFASINFNLLMSIAISVGCVVSKPFAASVVAGSVGVFIACVVIFSKKDNSSSLSNISNLMRRGRTLLPF